MFSPFTIHAFRVVQWKCFKMKVLQYIFWTHWVDFPLCNGAFIEPVNRATP